MKERLSEGYKNAERCRLVRGTVAALADATEETFDIIYCYGLLYHVSDPEAALSAMAQRCKGMLLLETCVSFGSHEAVNLVAENRSVLNKSFEDRDVGRRDHGYIAA